MQDDAALSLVSLGYRLQIVAVLGQLHVLLPNVLLTNIQKIIIQIWQVEMRFLFIV
jgi:hypothetical protein